MLNIAISIHRLIEYLLHSPSWKSKGGGGVRSTLLICPSFRFLAACVADATSRLFWPFKSNHLEGLTTCQTFSKACRRPELALSFHQRLCPCVTVWNVQIQQVPRAWASFQVNSVSFSCLEFTDDGQRSHLTSKKRKLRFHEHACRPTHFIS